MFFITPLIERFKKRGDLNVSNKSHWINHLLGGQNVVNQDDALKISTVFACVRVIAETIASLPLVIYRRVSDNEREPATDHPLYKMLHDVGPNSWLSAPEFWENCIGTNVLRGNAYNYKVFDNLGRLVGLVPMNPENVQIDVDLQTFSNPNIIYKFKLPGGGQRNLPYDRVWHLKGISSDGFTGLSPLQLAQNSMNLSLSSESHGNTFFRNSARPSGTASTPGKLSDDAYSRLQNSIEQRISGDKKFSVLLLEEGLTWSQIGMSNEDSQFLETRNFQVEDIARFYRVPSILLNHPEKTSTHASAEQFMMSFVTHTIRPWLVRVEKSIQKHLMTEIEQEQYYAEFKVDGLLRGDTKSRYEAYASAIQNTWMSPNEARKLENMPPRDGGDTYENPNVKPKESNNGNDED